MTTRTRSLGAVAAAIATTLAVVFGSLVLTGPERPSGPLAETGHPPTASSWIGTWGTSVHRSFNPAFDDVTLRLVVPTSTGGDAVRIRFANTYGDQPLRIGAVTVGAQRRGAELVAGSNRPVTFGGQRSVTVAEGAQTVSDPIAMTVPALTNLAVSLYLPAATPATTEHLNSNQTSYVSTPGDHSGDGGPARFQQTTPHWSFLQGIDVRRANGGTIVALGDSITAGGDTTYPEVLARRLQAEPRLRGLGVLNEGIGAAELLRRAALYGLSDPMLTRMDRDVLLQSEVRAVIVLAGTNDILGSHQASAEEIIAGYRQLVRRTHDQGVRVLGGTITPCSCFAADRERTRETVNRWIRTSGQFDGVVDFDRALRDPADPHRMTPAYHDPADPLHPNADGYRAMAHSVPLHLLSAR
ncbi:GDSL-type esterase/lipase family protein [Actinophytocola sediminis]